MQILISNSRSIVSIHFEHTTRVAEPAICSIKPASAYEKTAKAGFRLTQPFAKEGKTGTTGVPF